MFHEIPLKRYSMKYSERKILQCIPALTVSTSNRFCFLLYQNCASSIRAHKFSYLNPENSSKWHLSRFSFKDLFSDHSIGR